MRIILRKMLRLISWHGSLRAHGKPYSVFDESGKALYTSQAGFTPYLVKVSISDLNIRKGPGTNYAKTGKFTGKGVFTIVEVKSGKGSTAGWGRLKSGAGWISLEYAARI